MCVGGGREREREREEENKDKPKTKKISKITERLRKGMVELLPVSKE